jgi:hypothetical protein
VTRADTLVPRDGPTSDASCTLNLRLPVSAATKYQVCAHCSPSPPPPLASLVSFCALALQRLRMHALHIDAHAI